MSIAVRCAPLGARLKALRVHRIDLMILDVEGAELSVLRTIDFDALPLLIGVLVVEVRGDGKRAAVARFLMNRGGLTYVGQAHGRPSTTNDVVDDIFVSLPFLQKHWPASRAFLSLSPEIAGGLDAHRQPAPRREK